jgi:hypothetical protein
MNRGYDGNDIFSINKHKSHFLDYFEDSAKRMKIRIFAYILNLWKECFGNLKACGE